MGNQKGRVKISSKLKLGIYESSRVKIAKIRNRKEWNALFSYYYYLFNDAFYKYFYNHGIISEHP